MTEEPMPSPRWHQALAYAITGRRWEGLGRQPTPDLDELRDQLRGPLGPEFAAEVRERLQAGQVWPHPVPADLMRGIGYAQFAAALTALRAELGLGRLAAPARVGQDQAAAPDLRRLLDEVPPHHGT